MDTSNEGDVGQALSGTARTPRWTWRRRLLLGATLSAVVLLASCVGCVRVGIGATTEGAGYFERLVVSLGERWDAEVLIAQASPEFLQAMPPEKLRPFVAFVRGRLGRLRSCQPVQNGPWNVNLSFAGLAALTAHYQDCEFEQGPGRVTMSLVRRGGVWSVLTVVVNADALVAPGPQ